MQEDLRVIRDRAQSLAREQHELMSSLVQFRVKHHLRQEDVAERLGITQAAVSKFERYDSNPTLASIRRYALAVGVRLNLTAIDDLAEFSVEVDPLAVTRKSSRSSEVDWSRATGPVSCDA